MRRKIGIVCMLLGMLLVLNAALLFLWNRVEEAKAGEYTRNLMPVIREEIQQKCQTSTPVPEISENVPVELLSPEDLVMTEKEIDGNSYIGYLSIPDLNLDLPVMADWSYQKLGFSPCRYSGTLRGKDLVLMAHSYSTHFGQLTKLTEGSRLQFVDMDGNTWKYEVAVIDILDPYAVEEMIAGEYDLTLFTCTSNSTHRVTVRCNKIDM